MLNSSLKTALGY